MAVDVYKMVTDRILDMLNDGKIPWTQPWVCGNSRAISYVTRKPYSILNQMLLGAPGEYITFNQCKKLGGYVNKGAKSRYVVFWKMIPHEEVKDGKKQTDLIPFLRYYNVFSISDCTGIESKMPKIEPNDVPSDERAEATIADYVARSGVGYHLQDQDRAYYSPLLDAVYLPLREQFKGTAQFYETALHELVHSTGHESRLNRLSGSNMHFGSESYSKEELVAEIGCASMMNMLDLETGDTVRNNAAYVQSWMKALKNDPRMVVSAASKAQKAVEMIMNIKVEEDCEDDS